MEFSLKPNKITHWAARNAIFAAILIAVTQFINFAIGFRIGKNVLPSISTLEANLLVGLVGITVFVFQKYISEQINDASFKQRFALVFKGNSVLFAAFFILSLLAGSQAKQQENPTHSAGLFAAYEEAQQTKINGDSLLNEVKKQQQDSTVIGNSTATIQHTKKEENSRRVGYAALFLLAMVLSFFGFYLACAIACGGYGILAIFVFLFDFGIFGGGIYFLLKAFRKGSIKKWKEMDMPEKRKEFGRYLKTVFIMLGAAAILFLLSNI